MTKTTKDKTVCDKCGFAPLDFDFHKACHDMSDGKLTPAEFEAACAAE